MKHTGQWIRAAIAPAIFLTGVALFIAVSLGVCGCHLFRDPEEPKLPNYCYDESELRVTVFACVAKAQTKAASQACRKQVNESCGIIKETP